MRKYLFFSSLVLVALVLQTTVFNYLKVAGIKPDLVLILVVFYALLNGWRQGLVFGLLAGLLADIFVGRYIGMNIFTKMFAGYLFGWMETKLYKDNLFIPAFALFLGSFLQGFLEYFLSIVLHFADLSIGQAFWQVIIPGAIYNTCLAPFIYGRFYHSTTKGWLRNGYFANSV